MLTRAENVPTFILPILYPYSTNLLLLYFSMQCTKSVMQGGGLEENGSLFLQTTFN